jgi:hypothetical protein
MFSGNSGFGHREAMLLLYSLESWDAEGFSVLKKIASISCFPKQGAEVVPQSMSTISENLNFIRHLTSTSCRDIFRLGLRGRRAITHEPILSA